MNNNILNNFTILVTRPNPPGRVLCDLIEKAGGAPIFFPTIEIESLVDTSDFLEALMKLDSFDWLIFISPQAVYQAGALIKTHLSRFTSQPKIAALGDGTRVALEEMGVSVHLYPKNQWNSEGLLSLFQREEVIQKKIGLVRGEGGRVLLTQELTRLGAKLTHFVAYRRIKSEKETSFLLSLLQEKKIDIIITTSNDILKNLDALLEDHEKSNLYTVPLIVVSEKMRALAKNIGFKIILLAENASHGAIMATLKDHLCQMKLKTCPPK